MPGSTPAFRLGPDYLQTRSLSRCGASELHDSVAEDADPSEVEVEEEQEGGGDQDVGPQVLVIFDLLTHGLKDLGGLGPDHAARDRRRLLEGLLIRSRT